MEATTRFLEAALVGNDVVIDNLLSKGVDVNYVSTENGWSALMFATRGLHLSTVRLLLSHGADMTIKYNTMNLLHLLGSSLFSLQNNFSKSQQEVASYEYLEIWKDLIEAGVSMTEKNSEGETPFHLVCLSGNITAASFLLSGQYVSDINVKTNNGETPLDYANSEGFSDIVDILKAHHEVMQTILLPDDCLKIIVKLLETFEDLCVISLVCKAFYSVAVLDEFWKPLGSPDWEKQIKRNQISWKKMYIDWLKLYYSTFDGKNYQDLDDLQGYYHHSFHVALLGMSGVGKTSLVNRWCHNTFSNKNVYGTNSKHFTTKRGVVRLKIWDIDGRYHAEQFFNIRSMRGIFLVYSIVELESLIICQERYQAALQHVQDAVFLAVGTFSDLDHVREVTKERATELFGPYVPVIETSAKDECNIDVCFSKMVDAIFNGSTKSVSDPEQCISLPNIFPKKNTLVQKLQNFNIKQIQNQNIKQKQVHPTEICIIS